MEKEKMDIQEVRTKTIEGVKNIDMPYLGINMGEFMESKAFEFAKTKVEDPRGKYAPVLEEASPENEIVKEFLKETRLKAEEYREEVMSFANLTIDASMGDIAKASLAFENHRKNSINVNELKEFLIQKIKGSVYKEYSQCLWRLY